VNIDILDGLEHILFKRDVCWLLQYCPDGSEISKLCNPFFLGLIADDEPILVKRVHFETNGNGEQRCVLTAMFPQRAGGLPLINEIVCHAEHFQRVCKIAAIDLDRIPSEERIAEMRELRKQLDTSKRSREPRWKRTSWTGRVYWRGVEAGTIWRQRTS